MTIWGGIYSSTNLTNWTILSNPSGKELYHVTCPKTNLCFAVGESGVIFKSTDNTTWVQRTSPVPTNRTLRDIACTIISTCVAVGGNGSINSGTIVTTTDFTNWTLRSTTLSNTSLMAVTYYATNDLFITSGLNPTGSAGTATIYYYISSDEGVTWQPVTKSVTSGTSPTFTNYSLVCSNSYGCTGSGLSTDVSTQQSSSTYNTSFDGIVWSSYNNATTLNSIFSLTYNGFTVGVGRGGSTIIYGNPGASWVTVLGILSTSLVNLTTVISN